MRLTSSFEMILGAANGMHVEFSAVAFVGFCSRCGFRRSGCSCTGVLDWIVITVPGMFFLVRCRWVQGSVHSVSLFIGFMDVATGGSVDTLLSGCSPYEIGVPSTL